MKTENKQPQRKKYFVCEEKNGQKTGIYYFVYLNEEEKKKFKGFLYESELQALYAALN